MPLDNLEQLLEALLPHGLKSAKTIDLGKLGAMHCPTCSEECTMNVSILHFDNTLGQILLIEKHRTTPAGLDKGKAQPSLFQYMCVNCKTLFFVLLYMDESGPALAIFPNKSGGLSTPQTPSHVKYYLDQAYQAHLAGAYSASIAMYRAGLDQLLEDKGFTGRLPNKIAMLDGQIKSNTAPPWASKLVPDVLNLLKEIANSQMHPNDLAKLNALDAQFMHQVQVIFTFLLHVAYEEDFRKAQAKTKLKTALNKLIT